MSLQRVAPRCDAMGSARKPLGPKLTTSTLNRLALTLLPIIVAALATTETLASQQAHARYRRDDTARANPDLQHQQQQQQQVVLPDFLEPVANQTVALGRDAQFTCKISNMGHYRTAWLRVEDKGILTIHNNVITRNYRFGLVSDEQAASFQLTIKNVQPSDQGGYMCQINSVPMRSSVGFLEVLTPPSFEDLAAAAATTITSLSAGPTQANSGVQVVREGSYVNLSCKASGHPRPSISWRREDNEPIQAAPGEQPVGETLALGPVGRLHAGAYLCIASNGVQPSASKRQLLDVQFGPVLRVPQAEVGVQLIEGPREIVRSAQVRLVCHVDSNPGAQYYWVRLAVDTANEASTTAAAVASPLVAIARRRALEASERLGDLDDVSLIENGNQLGNSDKYEIVIKRQQQAATNNADADPEHAWSERGERVQMILLIRHVERKDLGWYKCIARNPLGTQSGAVRLQELSRFSLSAMFQGSGNSRPSDGGDSGELSDQSQDTSKPSHGSAKTNSKWLPSRSSSSSSSSATTNGKVASSASSIIAASPIAVLMYQVCLILLMIQSQHLLSLVHLPIARQTRPDRHS